MATFIGYSTINQYKKFTLTDGELVKRDLLNAFNIRQGTLPGRPDYGSTLLDYIFENQDTTTERAIIAEIQRIAAGDPRIYISDLNFYPQENGVLIELQVQIVPGTNTEQLSIFFDQATRQAGFV
jgi:phage baseplate assembly protein W